mmetsp:Transcript_14128/g.44126  ORF Transcript_14128/g.44126 Transcript_14128/m.44126 type:complete len:206 (+) Transcript_14128:511-1128(+)
MRSEQSVAQRPAEAARAACDRQLGGALPEHPARPVPRGEQAVDHHEHAQGRHRRQLRLRALHFYCVPLLEYGSGHDPSRTHGSAGRSSPDSVHSPSAPAVRSNPELERVSLSPSRALPAVAASTLTLCAAKSASKEVGNERRTRASCKSASGAPSTIDAFSSRRTELARVPPAKWSTSTRAPHSHRRRSPGAPFAPVGPPCGQSS